MYTHIVCSATSSRRDGNVRFVCIYVFFLLSVERGSEWKQNNSNMYGEKMRLVQFHCFHFMPEDSEHQHSTWWIKDWCLNRENCIANISTGRQNAPNIWIFWNTERQKNAKWEKWTDPEKSKESANFWNKDAMKFHVYFLNFLLLFLILMNMWNGIFFFLADLCNYL